MGINILSLPLQPPWNLSETSFFSLKGRTVSRFPSIKKRKKISSLFSVLLAREFGEVWYQR